MYLYIIFLAMSLSIDALSVGVAYGIKGVKIPILSKLLITSFSTIYSAVSILLGIYLSKFLSEGTCKLAGIILLFIVGSLIILQATKNTLLNPVEADADNSGKIELSEAFMLGLAISTDAIGVSLGMAMTVTNVFLTPIAIGVFQLLFLSLGLLIGKRFGMYRMVNKKALAVLPGIVIIAFAMVRLCF